MKPTRKVHGRRLEDFQPGHVYRHPWEVTLDEGILAFCASGFMETSPVYTSDPFAQGLGFRARVVHPLILLNFGLSFSVLDVSEQAIAHLAYIDVRFPHSAHAGDTLSAASEVLGTRISSSGDKGTVHVLTTVWNQEERPVCVFERKALIPRGKVRGDGFASWEGPVPKATRRYPSSIDTMDLGPKAPRAFFGGCFEDFQVGEVIVHDTGRTVGDSEHMQLTTLFRNTHPLHFDSLYCKIASFTGERVVYGGLVLGYTHAIAARDTGGQTVWVEGFDKGAHPGPVMAGDTIRAAQKVLAMETLNKHLGRITFRLVGVKNADPGRLLEEGADLFTPERGKKEGKVNQKILEIDRTVLVRRNR